MPALPLLDLRAIDLDSVLLDRDAIYGQYLPHAHEFSLLDAIVHLETDPIAVVSRVDVKPDAWWVRGHVPGRPLLPGVIMLEMAAQTSSVCIKLIDEKQGVPAKPFIAYGGVDACKFRDSVVPPATLYIIALGVENRPRRNVSKTQGWSRDRLVFEAKVTGLVLCA